MSVKYKTAGFKQPIVTKLKIGTKGVPQAFIDALGQDGILRVTDNKQETVNYISSGIYEDKRAAFRELLSNEARQARIAIKAGHGKPHYIGTQYNTGEIKNKSPHIITSLAGSELVIWGKNTMGMTAEEFIKIYLVAGRSGNLDDRETGMFGIGKLAYLAISDTMKVETFARKTGEKYGVLVDGLKCTPFECDLESYGTRVTLNIRDDVDMQELEKYMKKAGMFLKVDVYFERGHDGGTDKVGPITLPEYMQTNTYHDSIDKKKQMIHIKKRDYELVISPRSRDSVTTIHGMPIQSDFDLPTYFLNIINEKKYPPTATRDAFITKTYDALAERIKKDMKTYIQKKTDPDKSFRDVEFAQFLIHDIEAGKYVPQDSKWKLLGCYVSMHTAMSYKAEGNQWLVGDELENGTAEGVIGFSGDIITDAVPGPVWIRWRRFHEVLMLRDNMFYQKPGKIVQFTQDYDQGRGVQGNRREIEKLFKINPDAILITYDPEDEMGHYAEKMLRNAGLQNVTEYISEQENTKTGGKDNE